jgi:hypothetical protein
MISLKTWQITVGFDVAVSPEEVAALLATKYRIVQVGQGISQNGIPSKYIHVQNGARDER